VVDLPYEKFCLLDDDMLIWDECFFNGFKFLEHFDICVPMNPRLYVKHDLDGADVSTQIRQWFVNRNYEYLTAINFSPIFLMKYELTEGFCGGYLKEMKHFPCRGPLMLMKHILLNNLDMLILPESWCVCGENAQHWFDYKVHHTQSIDIMALHAGHKKVCEVFNVR